MPAFARLENRVNQAVMTHLVNAEARLTVGGEPFAVVFDAPATADAFDGQVDTFAPTCLGAAEDLGALGRGDRLLIGAQPYTVERAEPDGTGLVRLILATADPEPDPDAPGDGDELEP